MRRPRADTDEEGLVAERLDVLDAVGDGILVQVALVVLAAEGLEGAFAVGGLVHRGAGEAEEGGVRQAGHDCARNFSKSQRSTTLLFCDQLISVLNFQGNSFTGTQLGRRNNIIKDVGAHQ